MILVKEFGKPLRQIKMGEFQKWKLLPHKKFLDLGGTLIGNNVRIWKKRLEEYAEIEKSN